MTKCRMSLKHRLVKPGIFGRPWSCLILLAAVLQAGTGKGQQPLETAPPPVQLPSQTLQRRPRDVPLPEPVNEPLTPGETEADWTTCRAIFFSGADPLEDYAPVRPPLPAVSPAGRPIPLEGLHEVDLHLLFSDPVHNKAVVFGRTLDGGGTRPEADSASGRCAHRYDLATGRRDATLLDDVSPHVFMADLDPSGRYLMQVAPRPFGLITVHDLETGEKRVAFRPYRGRRDINDVLISVQLCRFVDADHILTQSGLLTGTLWKLPECRAIYSIQSPFPDFVLSPDRRTMAVLSRHDLRMYFLDVLEAKWLGSVRLGGFFPSMTPAGMGFSPGGNRFALFGFESRRETPEATTTNEPQIVTSLLWNLDGEFAARRTCFTTPFGRRVAWVGDHQYLLLGTGPGETFPYASFHGRPQPEYHGASLLDFRRELVTWEFRLPAGRMFGDPAGNRLWYLTPSNAAAGPRYVLGNTKLPDSGKLTAVWERVVAARREQRMPVRLQVRVSQQVPLEQRTRIGQALYDQYEEKMREVGLVADRSAAEYLLVVIDDYSMSDRADELGKVAAIALIDPQTKTVLWSKQRVFVPKTAATAGYPGFFTSDTVARADDPAEAAFAYLASEATLPPIHPSLARAGYTALTAEGATHHVGDQPAAD